VIVRVQRDPFDPWQELAAAGKRLAAAGAHGATAVFVGSLRDYNQGQPVSAMTLEHYPGMTEAHLEKVGREAAARWPILDALVVHRYGALTPGEPIVLVAVWSAHRDAAFAACRYIIDELKTRAPFWKRERTAAGARWVTPED
jgi:molybdopterin synthase catalytic subunit